MVRARQASVIGPEAPFADQDGSASHLIDTIVPLRIRTEPVVIEADCVTVLGDGPGELIEKKPAIGTLAEYQVIGVVLADDAGDGAEVLIRIKWQGGRSSFYILGIVRME